MRRVVSELEDELRQARRLHDLVERLDEITHDVTQELLDQDYEDDDDEDEEHIVNDDNDDEEEPRHQVVEHDVDEEVILVD